MNEKKRWHITKKIQTHTRVQASEQASKLGNERKNNERMRDTGYTERDMSALYVCWMLAIFNEME